MEFFCFEEGLFYKQIILITELLGDQYDLFVKQSLLEAKKLHEAKWIYALYGVLDGLSTSFSMLKYFFDMYYVNSRLSSDMVHDWILTPWGFAFVVVESTVLA